MKIWKLTEDVDKYIWFEPVVEMSIDEIRSFDGRTKYEAWHCLAIKPKANGITELGNLSAFIIPAFDQRTRELLHEVISNSVEELELTWDGRILSGINVTAVLDVIDYSKSDYETFSDGKRIMRFKKYSFRACKEIIENNIFRIVDQRRQTLFVTDLFKKVVEDNGLTGFKFELVWDDEDIQIDDGFERIPCDNAIEYTNDMVTELIDYNLCGAVAMLEYKDRTNILHEYGVTQMKIAMEEMINWLRYPSELGDTPEKIEYVDMISDDDYDYYIFKFTAKSQTADESYMLGVSGGYKKDSLSLSQTGEIFSDICPMGPDPIKHAKELLGIVHNWKSEIE